MTPFARGFAALRVLVLVLVLVAISQPTAFAKAPALTSLFPAGAARGQALIVTASGSFDHWPPKVWTDRGGLTIKPEAEKGKLSVQVDSKAEPGIVRIRLYDEAGATDLRAFVIGTLPEIEEKEPNNHPKHPQPIDLPSVTINGKLAESEDIDGYSVVLKRGQTLVADLEANRRLGSPMDAILQVVSARGFVLAQNNDTQGLDPRIVFEAPADAAYTVRVFAFPSTPDSTIRFAGGDTYVYRLTLTTGGFVDQVFPLAISQGETPASLAALGWNLGDAHFREFPTDDGQNSFTLNNPNLAGSAMVRRVDGEVVEEREPNDPGHPQAISSRAVVSGRIGSPGDKDGYEVALKKGEPRLFRVESRSLGFPLDATLRLLGPDGKTLSEDDDSSGGRDPQLAFTPPGDGLYRLVISDLSGHGGPRFAYLLQQGIPEPDFSLTLAADRFELTKEKPLSLAVTIGRENGFSDTIEITAEDLPVGLVAIPARSRQADKSAKSVTLELRAEGDVASGPIRIVGRRGDRKSRPRPALADIPGDNAKTDRPWVTLVPVPVPAATPKAK